MRARRGRSRRTLVGLAGLAAAGAVAARLAGTTPGADGPLGMPLELPPSGASGAPAPSLAGGRATWTAAPVPTGTALTFVQPAGWLATGADRTEYEFGTDRREYRSPPASGFLRATVPAPRGSTWLEQRVRAEFYRGTRLRLTGAVRAAGIGAGTAGLWLRADSWDGPIAVAWRPTAGAHGWETHVVVLDVPADALVLLFGLHLGGPGQLWADDLRLEAVGGAVPPSPTPNGPVGSQEPWDDARFSRVPDAPYNLDFARP